DGVECVPGQLVIADFRNRPLTGIVWPDDIGSFPDRNKNVANPKEAQPIFEIQPLSYKYLEFLYWISSYYMVPLGKVAKLALSIGNPCTPPKTVTSFALNTIPPEARITPKRQTVINLLNTVPSMTASDLIRESGTSRAIIRAMQNAGILTQHIQEAPITSYKPCDSANTPNDEQRIAMSATASKMGTGFHVTLLQGVTGSGKSEVYFDTINQCLAANKQALILLPEIAMSTQWLERFQERFGVAPLVWHSDIASNTRKRIWQTTTTMAPLVVVGARSAVFLPLQNLGVIIIDEEHDTSFKQSDGVRYNARDLALLRAHRLGISCILVSATPSVESYYKAVTGTYDLQILSHRFGEAQLPQIEIIDLRAHSLPANRWIAPPLHEAMIQTLAQGEQCLLFLNRRGYAPLLLCGNCGYRFNCDHCSSWMTVHGNLDPNSMLDLHCHQCGETQKLPHICPQYHSSDDLRACGPGVERLHEEVQALFPDKICAIAASDSLRNVTQIQHFFTQVQAGTVDIIIGTQMIAKGHHFPNLTLVGIIDADMGLQGSEIQAAERSFQTLHQVSGRAGRAALGGQVFIQTINPQSEFINILQKNCFSSFVKLELQKRSQAHWPPFGYLAALIISSARLPHLQEFCKVLARNMPVQDNIQIWGPAMAPIARVRDQHRVRFLVQSIVRKNMHVTLWSWVNAIKKPADIKIEIDIDPYNFS
ncbi:MAG: primosomal protein N', partial [Pseudomonadota bacterium]